MQNNAKLVSMTKPLTILFFFFGLLGLDLKASPLEFKGHCSVVKKAKYNSKNNSLEILLKDPIITLEKIETRSITVFQKSNKLKAKLAINSKNSILCPEDLSFKRASALKVLAQKKLNKKITFKGAMAKEFHVIKI